jgi:putative copper export protein/methionine-rich copper-binding protein CopC
MIAERRGRGRAARLGARGDGGGVAARPAAGSGRPTGGPRRPLLFTAALALWLVLCGAALAPAAPARGLIPAAPTHALPVRTDPPADAILQAPPARVRMWFSEDLNPLTSRIVVVDTTNHEVDSRDSHVTSDPREMDVSLPLLPAGTYVVAWRSQSAEDGHVVGGSYIFRIARPDGSVPPIPPVLPSGHVPGGGGVGASTGNGLDGPGWLQTVGTFLALLFMTMWVGGLIWETWILSPVGEADADLAAAGRAAGERFRRLAPWALGGLLVADVAMVLGLAAELAGDWSGLASPPLLRAVLFGSQFGAFWWLRELLAAAALALTVARARGATVAAPWRAVTAAELPHAPVRAPDAERNWGTRLDDFFLGLWAALRRGWRRRSGWGRVELLLGAGLLVAFALSGHAAAVASGEKAYALSIDLLHLAGDAAWVGGLLYIALVLLGALRALPERQRARVLARGLPQFSGLAIVTVVVLAATGSLNTTIHLTSITQFLTTTYGRTLAVKIELFLVMAAISAYHAFRLRPRLARELEAGEPAGAAAPAAPPAAPAPGRRATPVPAAVSLVAGQSLSGQSVSGPPRAGGAGDSGAARGNRAPGGDGNGRGQAQGADGAPAGAGDGVLGASARALAQGLEDWLRREAALGVCILIAVALLAAFAGSLTPSLAASGGSSSASSGAPYVSAPQTAGGLTATLRVSPDAFGTNTFTVTLRDARGQPVSGAGVIIADEMLDMDMGVQTAQLKPTTEAGVYSGQADLTMAGHWQVTVQVLPPNSQQLQKFVFRFSASY